MGADLDRSSRIGRLAWVGALLAIAGPAVAAEQDRPNVVLILADDLGWSDLGCYGADLHESPRIDRFATEGVRFTAAYAAPVCSPTRAALMTGKHPARLHMTIWYEASADPPRNRPLVPPVTVGNLPHDEVTIAEALREAGYATAHIGKWHLGDAAHYPETQGFDVNVGGTFWGAPSTHFFPFRGTWGNGDEYRYVPGLAWGEPGDYLSDRLTDAALEVIDRAGDRPFFLYLAYHAVHTPIEAPDGIVAKYRGKLSPGLHHRNPTYAAMVERLDANVGRVLDRLDERGLADETIVVFLSDNGGYINDYRGEAVTTNHPLRSGKGSLYEGGVRVPMIVRRPGEPAAGSVVDDAGDGHGPVPDAPRPRRPRRRPAAGRPHPPAAARRRSRRRPRPALLALPALLPDDHAGRRDP